MKCKLLRVGGHPVLTRKAQFGHALRVVPLTFLDDKYLKLINKVPHPLKLGDTSPRQNIGPAMDVPVAQPDCRLFP